LGEGTFIDIGALKESGSFENRKNFQLSKL
jgi:hypothetical protein